LTHAVGVASAFQDAAPDRGVPCGWQLFADHCARGIPGSAANLAVRQIRARNDSGDTCGSAGRDARCMPRMACTNGGSSCRVMCFRKALRCSVGQTSDGGNLKGSLQRRRACGTRLDTNSRPDNVSCRTRPYTRWRADRPAICDGNAGVPDSQGGTAGRSSERLSLFCRGAADKPHPAPQGSSYASHLGRRRRRHAHPARHGPMAEAVRVQGRDHEWRRKGPSPR
jgi:hypothetical protein